eukprot:9468506-Pyramimonas_sp.AAC.2
MLILRAACASSTLCQLLQEQSDARASTTVSAHPATVANALLTSKSHRRPPLDALQTRAPLDCPTKAAATIPSGRDIGNYIGGSYSYSFSPRLEKKNRSSLSHPPYRRYLPPPPLSSRRRPYPDYLPHYYDHDCYHYPQGSLVSSIRRTPLLLWWYYYYYHSGAPPGPPRRRPRPRRRALYTLP